jgi:hypothetical protein
MCCIVECVCTRSYTGGPRTAGTLGQRDLLVQPVASITPGILIIILWHGVHTILLSGGPSGWQYDEWILHNRVPIGIEWYKTSYLSRNQHRTGYRVNRTPDHPPNSPTNHGTFSRHSNSLFSWIGLHISALMPIFRKCIAYIFGVYIFSVITELKTGSQTRIWSWRQWRAVVIIAMSISTNSK